MPRKAELVAKAKKLGSKKTDEALEKMLNSALMDHIEKLQGEQQRAAAAQQAEDSYRYMLAVDPGDVHVGCAKFDATGCVDAWEMKPGEFLEYLRKELLSGKLVVLVMEEFRLYSWEAEKQSWSDFPTSQLIGASKAAVAWFGGPFDDDTGERRNDRDRDCVMLMQGANVKKPIRAILGAKGTKSIAVMKKAGNHAKDAELHGYWWLQRAYEKHPELAKKLSAPF